MTEKVGDCYNNIAAFLYVPRLIYRLTVTETGAAVFASTMAVRRAR
jgi:hypothetical protein